MFERYARIDRKRSLVCVPVVRSLIWDRLFGAGSERLTREVVLNTTDTLAVTFQGQNGHPHPSSFKSQST